MINKTALIYDNGLFVELASRLARDYSKVYYYMPWKNAFPRRQQAMIGEGVEGIERILDLWDVEDEVDTWIFPDVYDGDLVQFLRNEGRAVWGIGPAEFLELDRWRTRELQHDIGVDAPKTQRVVGLKELRKALSKKENLWVKVSCFRGDMETFHHESPFVSAPFLDNLATRLGAAQEVMEFLLEEHIEGVEVGYDGWTIDGNYPGLTSFGYEIKDLGYVGKVLPYAKLHPLLRQVNSALEPIFKEYGARGFMSTELRITKEKRAFLIDPCMRCGSPPTEGSMELWENLGEVIEAGAAGRIVDPKPKGKYFAMAMMHSSWATKHWTPVDVPADLKQWVKFRNLTVIDGKHYFVPQDVELPEIGAVVGIGDSLEEAIEQVDSVAEEIEGFQIEVHNNSFEKAMEVVEEGRELGIEF